MDCFSLRRRRNSSALAPAAPGDSLAYEHEVPKLKQAVSESGRAKLARLARESEPAILPQAVSEIPWGHNIVLLQKLKDPAIRLWYARQTVENGWSRAMLTHWIESGLRERQGKAITNFKATLPAPQSDLAAEVVRDPYNFDFLTLRADAAERDLERGLIDHGRAADVHAVAGQDAFQTIAWKVVGVPACRHLGPKPGTGKAAFAGRGRILRHHDLAIAFPRAGVDGTDVLAGEDRAGR